MNEDPRIDEQQETTVPEAGAERPGSSEAVAVIGMSCRFPGGADSPETYWRLLRNGVDAIGEIPPKRWDRDAYYDPDPDAAGKILTRHGGFLTHIDLFDPELFGIAPREAEAMDPQQRLLLEVAWEALENAGLVPEQLHGSSAGVWVGQFFDEYSRYSIYSEDPESIDAHSSLGALRSMSAGRLAYHFGFHGPVLCLDTACSSSLLAVHLASQSLRLGECDLALAGGVNLMLFPEAMVGLSRMRAISPDGRCKTFDAKADGYGRGEGCGLVVLKRLGDALRDGDGVLAVIRGSAVNHDGRSNGLTAPNGAAQESLLRQALASADVKPREITYVEAHGTGTALGDPIEVLALGRVLCAERPRDEPLAIGASKTNIGHLETAAGVAALIKAILVLQHGEIPPHLHFDEPNPRIPWDDLPITVPTTLTPLPQRDGRRIVGVSSFGMSGTNAHVLLEAPPSTAVEGPALAVESAGQEPGEQLLILSAKSEAALGELAARYRELIEGDAPALRELCTAAARERASFAHRAALVARSTAELTERLRELAEGGTMDEVRRGQVNWRRRPRPVFLFTGQGAQLPGMGRELYDSEPVFRQVIDRCSAVLPELDPPLVAVLYGGRPELLDETLYTQPALYAVECALAELWRSWGVAPKAVLGHSVGEYAAAFAAGIFTLEDGLRLIAGRARLMQALPRDGAMAAVSAGEAELTEILARHAAEVSLAALNGAESAVISGRRETVEAICESLAGRGFKTRSLNVSHAFHSPLMEPILGDFERLARQITFHRPRLEIVANVTGEVLAEGMARPEYWVEQIRRPVRFAAGMAALAAKGHELFVELGPQPILLGMAQRDGLQGVFLPSLRKERSARRTILAALGELFVRGQDIDTKALYPQRRSRPSRWALPNYPFQRQRYWLDGSWLGASPRRRESEPTVAGRRLALPFSDEVRFEKHLDVASTAFLSEHRMFDQVIVAAGFHLALVLAAVEEAFALAGHKAALEDVVSPRAMMLPDRGSATRLLQVVLRPRREDQRTFDVVAQEPDRNGDAAAAWSVHASGTVVLTTGPVLGTARRIDRAALAGRCRQEIPVASFYDEYWPADFVRGPSFRWLTRLELGEHEALAELRQPPGPAAEKMAAFPLAPGLIDSCFQLLSACWPADRVLRVPFSVDRFAVYGRPGDGPLWCHARADVDAEGDGQRGDLTLFDADGEVVAEILGFEVREVAREALLQGLERNLSGWLYEVAWQPLPAGDRPPVPPPPSSTVGRWLIFADGTGVGERLATALEDGGGEDGGGEVVVVETGPAFEQISPRRYRVDPASADDARRLFSALGGGRWEGVVHLTGLDATGENGAEAAKRLTCGSVLHLVQALVASTLDAPPPFWLVTRGAQSVDGEGVEPFQAALWGFGRVLARELPELRPRRLDLDPTAPADEIELLLAQLAQSDGEDEIAWRRGTRFATRLERPKAPTGDASATIRGDGTYLITGGTGGLGLSFAEWLVEQGARSLVLSSRRGAVDEAGRETLERLRARGATVTVEAADVAVADEVATLLSKIAAAGPPLVGVIHAAGVLDDGILQQQSWERFRRVLAPKIDGAWNLHLATRDLPLELFVCFSSAASILGNPGQGSYAAGNAFLDALAQQRRAAGLPGLAIAWGPFAGEGMLAQLSERERRRMSSQGMGMITAVDGWRLLGQLLAGPAATVGVLDVDWETFLRHTPRADGSSFFAAFETARKRSPAGPQGGFRKQLETAAVGERRALLEEHVRALVARSLGFEPASVPTEQGLFDLGLDSFMAMELKSALEKNLGCSLSATLVFRYPTVDEMVDFLQGDVLSELFAPASAVKDEPEPGSPELDALSADELAELLGERLSALSQEDAR